MNISSFEYFATLAQERNFTRAARRLHITQQSLSSHIATLEREIGVPLLVRNTPLELTAAGRAFLEHAEKINADMLAFRRNMEGVAKGTSGTIRIGVAFTRGRAIMPKAISRFQAEFPEVAVALEEASNDEIIAKLRNSDIDLAIARFSGEKAEAIETIALYEEEVVLAVPSSLLGNGKPSAKETKNALAHDNYEFIRTLPFVINGSEDIAGVIAREFFERGDFSPTIRASSNNVETLLELCARGVGACLCPANLIDVSLSEQTRQHIEVIELGDYAKYSIGAGVLQLNYRWAAIDRFIECALSALRQETKCNLKTLPINVTKTDHSQ